MKQFVFILFLCTFISTESFAQNNTFNKRIFDADEVVWFGIDFSKVQLIGSEGFTNPQDIKERFFKSWNKLINHESDKYNFQETYGFTTVHRDTATADARNKLPDYEKLVSESKRQELSKKDAIEICKAYKSEVHQAGLGLVYIVDDFNKKTKSAEIWVVFFDLATHDIVMAKEYETEAGGFGLRNYWARTFYELQNISKKEYKKSLKKFKKRKK